MKCLVAIIGPTAIGKSQLAIQCALRFNGEIINADSRQVYRYMDIGTAKPDNSDRSTVPHHLIDIVDPDEAYSLALYHRQAETVIGGIHSKDKLPILVGGTGQYVWSLIEDWSLPQVAPDEAFRSECMDRANREGADVLYRELQDIDPATAARIQPNNVRRIIRALEIIKATGQPASVSRTKGQVLFPVLIIGLTAERSQLYRLIDNRVDKMIKQGLIEEVAGLMDRGYMLDLPSMSGIGYKQIGRFIQGEINLEDAKSDIKFRTHAFARRQYTWFRLSDKRILWINRGPKAHNEAYGVVKDFLSTLGSAK